MFDGHDPWLVALSVVIAVLGGYTGFGLAARIRGTPEVSRRLLLASAAAFLAVGIWTMHFIGMLAAPIPANTVYLVLPTIISFLICALVAGVSLFFVSIGEPTLPRVASAAVLLGTGIASMHYVGIHGLAGNFAIQHDATMVALSILIAVVTAYGGLGVFLARQDGVRLLISAVAFGVAVSGMHYTAMYGMHFVPLSGTAHAHIGGLAASQQILSLVVAMLCFVIAAGFLLSLVPDPRVARGREDRRRVSRLRRQPPQDGGVARKTAGRGHRRRSPRPHQRAGRPRSRRHHAGGNRDVDPGRDHGGAATGTTRRCLRYEGVADPSLALPPLAAGTGEEMRSRDGRVFLTLLLRIPTRAFHRPQLLFPRKS
jgi:NO-binding membrane sensor protein with MHYT domain